MARPRTPKGRAVETSRRLAAEYPGKAADLCELNFATPFQLLVATVLSAQTTDDRVNQHGVTGYAAIVANPDDNESKIGFGQHGGLGSHEQHPFLIAVGGGFAARTETRPTSLIDIAPTVLRHLRMDHDDTDGRALALTA